MKFRLFFMSILFLPFVFSYEVKAVCLRNFDKHVDELYQAIKYGYSEEEIKLLITRGKMYSEDVKKKLTPAGQYSEAVNRAIELNDAPTTKLLVERYCEVRRNWIERHCYVIPAVLGVGFLMAMGCINKMQ